MVNILRAAYLWTTVPRCRCWDQTNAFVTHGSAPASPLRTAVSVAVQRWMFVCVSMRRRWQGGLGFARQQSPRELLLRADPDRSRIRAPDCHEHPLVRARYGLLPQVTSRRLPPSLVASLPTRWVQPTSWHSVTNHTTGTLAKQHANKRPLLLGVALLEEMPDPDPMKDGNQRNASSDKPLSELQREVARLGRALEGPPALWKPRARHQLWHFVCIGLGVVATAVFFGTGFLT